MKAYWLIFCGALAACTLGPDYEKPPLEAPDRFVSQEILPMLNTNIANQELAADWWEGFQDPLLSTLVETGLANNYTIAAAAARAKQARARIQLAGADDELQSDASLQGEVEKQVGIEGSDRSQSGASFGLVFLLPLDIFGSTARSVEAAQAGFAAARAELNDVVLDTSAAIVSEYLRLRGNQRQLELLRESVALQEKTLSIVRSRFDAGLSPELDVRRAETSVENLRADIPPLEEALLGSRNRIAQLTGDYPGRYEAQLRNLAPTPSYQRGIPALIPLQVLEQRPDVAQAEAYLKQEMAEIGVAKAAYYPSFSLTSQISIGTTGVSGAPSTDLLIGSIGALIQQVLTDGGARDATMQIATAEAEEALANYEQTLRNASEEVESVLAAIRASLARQISLERAVNSSRRSFEQAETLYQEGLISFLDVVDAQRVNAQAEQNLANERTQYATQIASLFRVLGTKVTANKP